MVATYVDGEFEAVFVCLDIFALSIVYNSYLFVSALCSLARVDVSQKCSLLLLLLLFISEEIDRSAN